MNPPGPSTDQKLASLRHDSIQPLGVGTTPYRMRIGLLICGFLWLGLSYCWGQTETDSTTTPSDSLFAQLRQLQIAPPPIEIPILPPLATRRLQVGNLFIPRPVTEADTPKGPLHIRVYQVLKEQVPEVYHNEEDKLRLHIPIAWREDIDIPLPKAFERVGARPPFDPVVAWQRSLIIPGWGQIYNRDYWKLPIFLVGYGAATWWVLYNHNLYLELRVAYRASLTIDLTDDDPRFSNFDSEGIRNLREDFRNRRDQGILILAGWHVVQVAEAYVAAHMKGFDVSKDLSLRPHPTLIPSQGLAVGTSPAIGLGISLQF